MNHEDDYLRGPDLPSQLDPAYRTVLIQSAVLSGVMFLAEGLIGLGVGSAALIADAIDFLQDAFLYLMGVVAIGWTLRSRAIAGFSVGLVLFAVGLVALGQVFVRLWYGGIPSATAMSLTAAVALTVNVIVAVRLLPYRSGDSSMRAIWLSARTDALMNGLVIIAGVLVANRLAAWPDIVAGLVIASVNLYAARTVITAAWAEMNATPPA